MALLGLTLIITATGWLTYKNTMGEGLDESHEVAANLMLALVGIHLAGVGVGSWLHRENLAKAMVTGYKSADRADGIRRSRWGVAALVVVAVLAFWGLQWQGPGSSQGGSSVAPHGEKEHDGDD